MNVNDPRLPTTASNPARTRSTGRLRVEGAEIHYERCGEGPVIVFAHGLGGNHMSWWQQVGHFERAYTCVTFAHRGFTPSSVEPGQLDPVHYANDLTALLDHLKIEQAHLVGQSMGGWTVLEYCLRHPHRVNSLVLSATVGSIAPNHLRHLDAGTLACWQRDAARSADQARLAMVHPAAGRRMAKEQPGLHRLYQHIDELSQAVDKETLRIKLRDMRTRTPGELAATGVPVLVVSPQEDIVIPPLALRALSEELEHVRFAELSDSGHSPYFERAQAFNQCLDDFFREITRDH